MSLSHVQFVVILCGRYQELSMVYKGYTLTCPECLGNDTYYSCLEEGWLCLDCGTVFQAEVD